MGKIKPPAKANQGGLPELDEGMLAELACTNTALRRAARRLGSIYDDELAPLHLKATQVGLIAEIERLRAEASKAGSGGPTLQDLAGRLAIQVSALTHALRPLLRDGFVALQQDQHDKRIKNVSLTRQGKSRLAEALKLWEKANTRVEVVLGHQTASHLRSLADHIASDEFLSAYHADKGGSTTSAS